MKDIPIIFSGPMVCALLEGRKTMTRRLATRGYVPRRFKGADVAALEVASPWQRVKAGDRLWVREVFMPRPMLERIAKPHYRADQDRSEWRGLWKPSIHMPRWASRLTLIVTATKIERLIRISNADAIAEGCGVNFDHPIPELTLEPFPAERFRDLWKKLHGTEAWDANPEVVALTFTVHKSNIDAMPKAEAA